MDYIILNICLVVFRTACINNLKQINWFENWMSILYGVYCEINILWLMKNPCCFHKSMVQDSVSDSSQTNIVISCL